MEEFGNLLLESNKTLQSNLNNVDDRLTVIENNTNESLNDINDVVIDNLTNNQVLKYNSTTQVWENQDESGGGGGGGNYDPTNVAITGGSISGISPLAIGEGGTGASTAEDARSNLGLGTIATQGANSVDINGGNIDGTVIGGAVAAAGTFTNVTSTGTATLASVAITGGSISGISPLAIGEGGTGASTAEDARSNLGLGTIATQGANSVDINGGNIDGTVIGGAVAAAGTFTNVTSTGTATLASVAITGGSISGISPLAIGEGGTGASTAEDARSNLGLGTIATQGANSVDINGGNIDGTVIGGAVAAAGTFTNVTSTGTATLASVAITGGSISGISPLAIGEGGTGASTAEDARSNLGLGTIATQGANSVDINGGNIDGTVIGGAVAAAGTFNELRIDNEINLGANNPGTFGQFLVSGGPSAAPSWRSPVAGEIYKLHILQLNTSITLNNGGTLTAGYHTVVDSTFNKTVGTHLYAECHFSATIAGFGEDSFSTRLNIQNSTSTFVKHGQNYITMWTANTGAAGGGGGHRSLGGQPATSSAAGAVANDESSPSDNKDYGGALTITMQLYLDNASDLNDSVTFEHGFFKIFEIWA
jgi:hypothetical protein